MGNSNSGANSSRKARTLAKIKADKWEEIGRGMEQLDVSDKQICQNKVQPSENCERPLSLQELKTNRSDMSDQLKRQDHTHPNRQMISTNQSYRLQPVHSQAKVNQSQPSCTPAPAAPDNQRIDLAVQQPQNCGNSIGPQAYHEQPVHQPFQPNVPPYTQQFQPPFVMHSRGHPNSMPPPMMPPQFITPPPLHTPPPFQPPPLHTPPPFQPPPPFLIYPPNPRPCPTEQPKSEPRSGFQKRGSGDETPNRPYNSRRKQYYGNKPQDNYGRKNNWEKARQKQNFFHTPKYEGGGKHKLSENGNSSEEKHKVNNNSERRLTHGNILPSSESNEKGVYRNQRFRKNNWNANSSNDSKFKDARKDNSRPALSRQNKGPNDILMKFVGTDIPSLPDALCLSVDIGWRVEGVVLIPDIDSNSPDGEAAKTLLHIVEYKMKHPRAKAILL